MIEHWTVVGYYPVGSCGSYDDGETYVEHVTFDNLNIKEYIGSEGVKSAVSLALAIKPTRKESIIIAVFRGHLDDEYNGLGMSTERHQHD